MQEGTVNIDNYSDKAVVVSGDTKPVKDQLKAQGGRFNPRLKGKNGKTFVGWIFSKKAFKERMVYDILKDCQRDGLISGVQINILAIS